MRYNLHRLLRKKIMWSAGPANIMTEVLVMILALTVNEA